MKEGRTMSIEKFKAMVRKTPFIKLWRKAINKSEYCKIMRINRKYKKAIQPLIDNPEYLEEKMKELDKNAKGDKKVFYIIALKLSTAGIYGYINNFLPHIAYAVSKGFIPVIDMQNYDNIYLSKDKGTYNSWESFYEQPMGFGLDDLSDGQVIRCLDTLWYRWAPLSCPLMSDKDLAMWSAIYNRYIRYNKKSVQYIESEQKSILKNPQNTIGVIYRGTDYTKGHPIGHPIQPSMKKLSDKVDEMLKSQKCEYIYLASDEKEIVTYFNKRFSGKVLINKRVYYDEATNVDYSNYNNDHIGVSGAEFNRDNNKYLIGIEYISSMNLVSNCSCLVAGACGGTTAVLYMNALKYREKYIFNLGKYGFDPIPND